MPINAEAKPKTEEFEVMALAHIDSVYKFALYMAGNESDAQDLVQNTYLKAYRSFDKFEKDTNCKAWLLTILNDTLMSTIHYSRKHPPAEEERRTGLSSEFNPERDDDVAIAISGLPIRYRAVVLLADVERFSYKEIADIVGCPVGTVISRLCRGHRLLRRRLQRGKGESQ